MDREKPKKPKGTVGGGRAPGQRNILPLALAQAILGTLTWWAFPLAWHHSLRVGPAYYLPY